jgi:hypothetical protein
VAGSALLRASNVAPASMSSEFVGALRRQRVDRATSADLDLSKPPIRVSGLRQRLLRSVLPHPASYRHSGSIRAQIRTS